MLLPPLSVETVTNPHRFKREYVDPITEWEKRQSHTKIRWNERYCWNHLGKYNVPQVVKTDFGGKEQFGAPGWPIQLSLSSWFQLKSREEPAWDSLPIYPSPLLFPPSPPAHVLSLSNKSIFDNKKRTTFKEFQDFLQSYSGIQLPKVKTYKAIILTVWNQHTNMNGRENRVHKQMYTYPFDFQEHVTKAI